MKHKLNPQDAEFKKAVSEAKVATNAPKILDVLNEQIEKKELVRGIMTETETSTNLQLETLGACDGESESGEFSSVDSDDGNTAVKDLPKTGNKKALMVI